MGIQSLSKKEPASHPISSLYSADLLKSSIIFYFNLSDLQYFSSSYAEILLAMA